MTTEEAIEILSDVGDINRCCAEDAEALDMAIKVLERQPCEDCVSRKDVLAMKRVFVDEDGVMAYAVPTGNILRLLSVQPIRPTGKWKRIHPQGIYECSKCGINLMTEDIECYEYCHGCGARMEV